MGSWGALRELWGLLGCMSIWGFYSLCFKLVSLLQVSKLDEEFLDLSVPVPSEFKVWQ